MPDTERNMETDIERERREWRKFLDAICGRPKGAPREPIKPELTTEEYDEHVDWLFPETQEDALEAEQKANGETLDELPPAASDSESLMAEDDEIPF